MKLSLFSRVAVEEFVRNEKCCMVEHEAQEIVMMKVLKEGASRAFDAANDTDR